MHYLFIYLFCRNSKESLLLMGSNVKSLIWAASSKFGTYRLCEQRRFRRACISAQSRQNLRCSLIQAVSQEEPSDRKPDPWPLWITGHAQLKFVMTECSKTLDAPHLFICRLQRYHSCIQGMSHASITNSENVSLGIFDQVRVKPACSATEAR